MKNTIYKPLAGWLFLAFLLAAPALTAAAPAAVVPEAVYEFPDIPDGEYVVHDFVIRNEGDTVLNVLKVKTT
jgi:hypothetical protein